MTALQDDLVRRNEILQADAATGNRLLQPGGEVVTMSMRNEQAEKEQVVDDGAESVRANNRMASLIDDMTPRVTANGVLNL